MDSHELADFRENKDHFFGSHPHSPLTPEQKTTFDGLSYYPHNPDLLVHATIKVNEEQEQMLMRTNRDELRPFFRYGTFDVTVGGETATLTVYRSPDYHFFLPFVDVNSGTETYPAGRYLDLDVEADGTALVDFNQAYNPYCAYNDRFVCPITPKENRIAIPVRTTECDL
ncbi:MAG: DUF1684 domain-containing protein [Chloroflexota bacterium]